MAHDLIPRLLSPLRSTTSSLSSVSHAMEYPTDLTQNTSPSSPILNDLQFCGNSAFEYAVNSYLDDNVESSPVLPFPSPSTVTSIPSSDTASSGSSDYSTWNHQLYPPPSPDEPISHHLHVMSTDQKARYQNLRLIFLLCSTLSIQVLHWPKKSTCACSKHRIKVNSTPITNFYRICHLVRRRGLPIANRLGIPELKTLCRYWIGRGEAGVGEWDAARSAFEAVLNREQDLYKLRSLGLLPIRQGEGIRELLKWVEKQQKEAPPRVTNREDLDDYLHAVQEGDYPKAKSLADEFEEAYLPPHIFEDEALKPEEADFIKRSVDKHPAKTLWYATQQDSDAWLSLWEKEAQATARRQRRRPQNIQIPLPEAFHPEAPASPTDTTVSSASSPPEKEDQRPDTTSKAVIFTIPKTPAAEPLWGFPSP